MTIVKLDELDIPEVPFDYRFEESSVQPMLTGLQGTSEVYDSIQKGAPDSFYASREICDIEHQVLTVVEIQKDPPVSLAVTKSYYRYKADSDLFPSYAKGEEVEKCSFIFFRGTTDIKDQQQAFRDVNSFGQQIGEVIFERQENVWNLRHRFIEEPYRKKNFLSGLLKAAEFFVQEYTEKKGETQTIIINIGQPSVLQTFLKKGYKPQTEKDQLLFNCKVPVTFLR